MAAGSDPWTEALVGAKGSSGSALLEAIDQAKMGLTLTVLGHAEARLVYVNDAGAEILGWPRDELVGSAPQSLLKAEYRPTTDADGLFRYEGAEPWQASSENPGQRPWFETQIVRKDGQVATLQVGLSRLELDGQAAVVALFFDVSLRRRSMEALAKSEKLFRQLVEGAPEAMWISSPKGLHFVNPAAVTLLGYPDAETLLRKLPLELVHPADHAILIARFQKVLAEGVVFAPVEYRTFRHDRTEILVETSSIRIEWEGAPAILSFGRNVSPRKEMEARLMQTERLAALGTMVSGIAHEINNPLMFSMLSLDLAVRALEDRSADRRAEAIRHIAEAREGAERVSDIVTQLRAFARSDTEDRVSVSMRQAVDNAIRIAGHELKHRARLELEFAEVRPVLGVARRLEQVFVNLLVNAAHAMPEDRIANNEVRVTCAEDGRGSIVLRVTDNGRGIAPETLPRIFDPFFTTKAPGEGLGLGLSVCHAIVVAHGGSIDVESEPGRGTSVTIKLPIEEAAVPGPSEPVRTPPVSRESGVRRKIIIVDDEFKVAVTLAALLKPRFECTPAADGQEALALIAKERPDAVLCDLMMPGMTGIELVEEVSRRWPGLERRFVYMTGGAFTARAEEFLERTENPILTKPFDKDRLIEAVEQVLEE